MLTAYLISVMVSFLTINIAESYRCRRMKPLDFFVNTATSVIPVLNLFVAVLTVNMAINK